jgi:hypothetical protein
MAFLNGQIAVVKLIRSFCNLGLGDCKAIADLWQSTYNNNYVTDNIYQVYKLGSICKMVVNGDWIIEHNQIIMIKKLATKDNVLELIP